MGARGALKLVHGLASTPNVTGSAAGDVPRVAPIKPAVVANDAVLSELWDEIVPQLDAAGLLSPSDGPAVEMCLRHFAAARRASDEFMSGPVMVWDEKNQRDMKNPADMVLRSQSSMFLEYARQLGMTFVSRARTPGKEASDGGAENPFAAAL